MASISPPVISNPCLHVLALSSAVYNQHTAIEADAQEHVYLSVSKSRAGEIQLGHCCSLTDTFSIL